MIVVLLFSAATVMIQNTRWGEFNLKRDETVVRYYAAGESFGPIKFYQPPFLVLFSPEEMMVPKLGKCFDLVYRDACEWNDPKTFGMLSPSLPLTASGLCIWVYVTPTRQEFCILVFSKPDLSLKHMRDLLAVCHAETRCDSAELIVATFEVDRSNRTELLRVHTSSNASYFSLDTTDRESEVYMCQAMPVPVEALRALPGTPQTQELLTAKLTVELSRPSVPKMEFFTYQYLTHGRLQVHVIFRGQPEPAFYCRRPGGVVPATETRKRHPTKTIWTVDLVFTVHRVADIYQCCLVNYHGQECRRFRLSVQRHDYHELKNNI